VSIAARLLYPDLLADGVQIYEYCRRPLHAKVACVDDDWSTVGSSNLDPLSLFLNIEANVIVRDPEFTAVLSQRLRSLIESHCATVNRGRHRRSTLWRRVMAAI